MSNTLKLIIASSAAIMVAGCNHAGAEEAGPDASRTYPVDAFDRIEVAGPYDVDVRTGPAASVSATGAQNAINRMIVEVRGGKLLIHARKENGTFNWGSRGLVKIAVTVPQLRGAHIAGSGDMRIDRVKAQSFDGGIAGSGDLSLGEIEVEALNFDVGGSGSVEAKRGRAQSISLNIAGSGDIDTSGIVAETASASIAGSGNITAQATQSAAISVLGSGDVALSGGAKCSVSKAGSGNVRCS